MFRFDYLLCYFLGVGTAFAIALKIRMFREAKARLIQAQRAYIEQSFHQTSKSVKPTKREEMDAIEDVFGEAFESAPSQEHLALGNAVWAWRNGLNRLALSQVCATKFPHLHQLLSQANHDL